MASSTPRPGQIWETRPITSDFLEQQWLLEVNHKANSLDMKEFAFTESDWKVWDWNANMGLLFNSRWNRTPALLRNLLIPQMTINHHFIESFQKLIGGWQQWGDLARLKQIYWQPDDQDLSSLLLSGINRLDQARGKYDSLTYKNQAFQIVSLRQHRFFQNLAALLMDLEPLVQAVAGYAAIHHREPESVLSARDDILWHSREAFTLVGSLQRKPSLMQRLQAPRVRVNRMLGIACLCHCTFLRVVFKSIQE